jgi:hypothetical protein
MAGREHDERAAERQLGRLPALEQRAGSPRRAAEHERAVRRARGIDAAVGSEVDVRCAAQLARDVFRRGVGHDAGSAERARDA